MSKFWKFRNNVSTDGQDEVSLWIQGDIVDDDDLWLYEWFGEAAASPNAFREELNQFAGKDLTVFVDSYGGSVFAGASIYNALKEHKGKVTVKIDGKAMSAASVIAMAGDEIQMSPVGMMMIHNPLTAAVGNQHDLRKTADVLDEIKESIMNAYILKTGRTRADISQMMDDETYMSATKAIDEGFADSIIGDIEVQNSTAISFNRMAVLNSAGISIGKAMELLNKPAEPPQVESLEMLLKLNAAAVKAGGRE